MFLFCQKEILLLLFMQLRKSPGKSWKGPGTLMQKGLEKVKKSPGKSWNLNQFFLEGTMYIHDKNTTSEPYRSGFELMYCDSGNTMYFSYFAVVFPIYPGNHDIKI